MTAARQAEVVARDLHPLVLGRRRQHLLQQLVVAPLELVARAQRPLRLADTLRERVADRLQVTQPEDPGRRRDGGDAGLDPLPLEALGDERAELSFEAADLAPQLRSRQPLVATRAEWRKTISFERCRHTRAKV